MAFRASSLKRQALQGVIGGICKQRKWNLTLTLFFYSSIRLLPAICLFWRELHANISWITYEVINSILSKSLQKRKTSLHAFCISITSHLDRAHTFLLTIFKEVFNRLPFTIQAHHHLHLPPAPPKKVINFKILVNSHSSSLALLIL